MSLIAGNTSSATAEEAVANAGAHLKGRIFAVGSSIGLSLAFLIGGFSLAFGQDELVAASLAMGSFLVVTILSFFAEIIVEPSLERVAQEREGRRIQEEIESLPSAGGLLGSRLPLTGGADPDHPNALASRLPDTLAGTIGAPKGRRLDITLPEEHHSPAIGGSAGNAARGSGGRASAASEDPGKMARGSGGAQRPPAPEAKAPSEDFQDLASLLAESNQPSPVPARQRQ